VALQPVVLKNALLVLSNENRHGSGHPLARILLQHGTTVREKTIPNCEVWLDRTSQGSKAAVATAPLSEITTWFEEMYS